MQCNSEKYQLGQIAFLTEHCEDVSTS